MDESSTSSSWMTISSTINPFDDDPSTLMPFENDLEPYSSSFSMQSAVSTPYYQDFVLDQTMVDLPSEFSTSLFRQPPTNPILLEQNWSSLSNDIDEFTTATPPLTMSTCDDDMMVMLMHGERSEDEQRSGFVQSPKLVKTTSKEKKPMYEWTDKDIDEQCTGMNTQEKKKICTRVRHAKKCRTGRVRKNAKVSRLEKLEKSILKWDVELNAGRLTAKQFAKLAVQLVKSE